MLLLQPHVLRILLHRLLDPSERALRCRYQRTSWTALAKELLERPLRVSRIEVESRSAAAAEPAAGEPSAWESAAWESATAAGVAGSVLQPFFPKLVVDGALF